ncbi:MAG: SDR family oxidoreductase [Candidatus Neomarinimicrobiota bacterium]
MEFKDKVIMITGASSGIGKALALAFSREGAQVILASRRPEELEKVRQECTSPKRHYVLQLDLTIPDVLVDKVRLMEEKFGRIDILVNNGGITQRSLIKDTSMTVVRKIMETNYFSAVALSKAVLPGMIERRSGNIIFISSLTGKFGTALRSIYASSKHALLGFADALRAEVWDDGIRVHAIMPGFVRTNASLNALTGDGSKHATMDKTTDKGMSPAECAAAILKAVQAGKEEVLISGKEKVMVYLKRLSPALFSKVIRKIKVT